MPTETNPRILFVSANNGGGGSEELWVQAASQLNRDGVAVRAATTWSSRAESRFRQLENSRITHTSLTDTFADKVRHRLSMGARGGVSILRRQLRLWKPNLIVFNSGGSLDGLDLLQAISDSKIPYLAITHLVSSDNWPDDSMAAQMRSLFGHALRACFVSQHNRMLFETQVGTTLHNAHLVRNPYLVDRKQPLPWPDQGLGVLKLAFPARIHPRTKGHDILIDVLSIERWRSRNVTVSFFGKGPWQKTLSALIQTRGLSNAHFHGHVSDIESIWQNHHGLILPSRHEGLPICLVEAMMVGRPSIVNPAGGSAEFIQDGLTGFVSAASTVEALDETMERAWQARDQWPQMGAAAAMAIRSLVPADPAKDFATQLLSWFSAISSVH